jgi:hypothetical protein
VALASHGNAGCDWIASRSPLMCYFDVDIQGGLHTILFPPFCVSSEDG